MVSFIGSLCLWLLLRVTFALSSTMSRNNNGSLLAVPWRLQTLKAPVAAVFQSTSAMGTGLDKPVSMLEFPGANGAMVHETAMERPLQRWEPIMSVPQFGSLACMGWTGAWCGFLGCNSLRGPTTCVQNRCMCQTGHCASAEGICEKAPGTWLGNYSIKFSNPANPTRPYLGKSLPQAGLRLAATEQAMGWRLAISSHGYLRFEPIGLPGLVLIMKDHMPELATIEDVRPSQASFQVRQQSFGNSSGLELWNPMYRASLASITSLPRANEQEGIGVAVCRTSSCTPGTAVIFQPKLPEWFHLSMPRGELSELSVIPQYTMGISMGSCLVLLAFCVSYQLDAVKNTQYMGLFQA